MVLAAFQSSVYDGASQIATNPFAAAANDPWVQQTQNLFEAQKKADAAQLASLSRQSFIDFGGVPDFGNLGISTQSQPWLAHFDPSTQALAQQNTQAGTSLLAQLQKQLADANRTSKNQLAGRGMLFSGETPYQLSENALANKQATYNASREFLDQLSGAYAALTQRQQERDFGLLQSQQDAAIRQQEIAFRQQENAQQMALAQQQMAMERQFQAQSLAANQAAMAGGGGGDVGSFLDSLFGPGGGGAPMPTSGDISAAHAVSRKAARHRTQAEKDTLSAFNQQFGAIGQYLGG